MPALFLIVLALSFGATAGAIVWLYPRRYLAPGQPSVAAGRKLGESAQAHPALRTALRRRLDPESATGLALSIALGFTAGAGVVLGLLAYLVRTNARLAAIDNGVARWGNRHASPLSTHVLNAVTQLGSIYVVIGLCVVLAVVELRRTRSRWIVPFLVAVVGGAELASTAIKAIVDRARPAFNPAAATLGPSFPSGHTTAAASFYAAAALLLGRRRSHGVRAAIAGGAVGIAVAVAASRVLLDVHWLTDVIGGLALGWAWFALCAIAFGGRLLRLGVPLEVAGQVASGGSPPRVDATSGARTPAPVRSPGRSVSPH
jgi:membrane-associated phospholipid phosphatase